MHSWHDYTISGYSVDGRRKRLVFKLENDVQRPSSYVNLIFEGVEAYLLLNDLGLNWVDEFAEQPLREFLVEWKQKFEEERKWGWPVFWRFDASRTMSTDERLEAAYEWLVERRITCTRLSTSYGLYGWILASSTSHELVEA